MSNIKIVKLTDNNLDGDFLDLGEEVDIIGDDEAWETNNYHEFHLWARSPRWIPLWHFIHDDWWFGGGRF